MKPTKEKKNRIKVFAIIALLLFVILSNQPKKESVTQATCDQANNIGCSFQSAHGVENCMFNTPFTNDKVLLCKSNDCKAAIWNTIELADWYCTPCVPSGWRAEEKKDCCSGDGVDAGDGYVLCKAEDPANPSQCSGEVEKIIADLVWSVGYDGSCKSAYYLGLGGGVFLVIFLIAII